MSSEKIAIIGMAARTPGANGLDDLWERLRAGRNCIGRLSEEELAAAGVRPEEMQHPDYVRARPLVEGADLFDAEFFHVTRREAEVRDPQQRVFLETVYLAMENAGYDPRDVPGVVGVFGGAAANEYAEHYVRRSSSWNTPAAALLVTVGNHNDYVGSSVAYALGYTGPALTVATACSTSLVAVHLAINALRNGEVDVAVAGGANLEMPYGRGYRWVEGSIMSRDGVCRPFDAKASGTVFGSGVGVVILKRLQDAERDRDHVWAVVSGSAVNNDGGEKMSFGAPSARGQAAVVVEAMALAGVRPHDIDYVEAHGTGTIVGDPLEVAGLQQAYGRLLQGEALERKVSIGSVKSNIGHLGSAAGVVGLIKTVLCLDNEELVPTVNLEELNPKVAEEGPLFEVLTAVRPWKRDARRTRRAGVSSFGVGGTNAHVVVEEPPAVAGGTAAEASLRPLVLPWSARTDRSVTDYETVLREALSRTAPTDGEHVQYTLARSRSRHGRRRALVVVPGGGEDADRRAGLTVLKRVVPVAPSRPDAAPVVFCFPGQGAQHPAMACGLREADPELAHHVDQLDERFAQHGIDLSGLWGPEVDPAVLARTEIAQPLLVVVELAMAAAFRRRGIEPAVVLGHSLGELSAAAVAGVMSEDAAVAVVAARARAMQSLAEGSMLAVRMPLEDLRPHLSELVEIAAVNGAKQVVVSGPTPVIDELHATLSGSGAAAQLLQTSRAFHSRAMAPAIEPVHEVLGSVELRAPSVPMVSCLTGRLLGDDEATDPKFWVRQLVEPVLFHDALTAALEAFDGPLLEVGPGRTLTSLARHHAAVVPSKRALVSSLRNPDDTDAARDVVAFEAATAQLWVEGARVDWDALVSPQARTVPLPGYQFDRQRYWVLPDEGLAAPASGNGKSAEPAPVAAPATPVPEVPAPEKPVAAATAPAVAAPPPVAASPEIARPAARAAAEDPVGGEPADRLRGAVSAFRWFEDTRFRPRRGRPLGRGTAAVALPEDPDARRRVLRWVGLSGYRAVPLTAEHELQGVDLVVDGHLLGAQEGATEERLGSGFHETFRLLQAVMREGGPRRPTRFAVLADHSVDVTGGEPLDPFQAMVGGLVRSARDEDASTSFHAVDVTPRSADEAVAGELGDGGSEAVVAIRGRSRWVQRECATELGEWRPVLRRRGVYLVTGGLGALGRQTARSLAETGLEPRLVLVSRREAAVDGDAELEALRTTGAVVEVAAADVADRRAMARLVDSCTVRHGPFNGVFHAAGVGGGGLMAFRSLDDVDAVLRPKVLGSLVLEEIFAERPPLDVVVHFSSRASTGGLLGAADYAAANGFLDALAETSPLAGGRVMAVGWPSWVGGGMADPERTGVLPTGPTAPRAPGWTEYSEKVLTDAYWPLSEHRIGGRGVLPGTAHIDLLQQVFAKRMGAAGGCVISGLTFVRPWIADRRSKRWAVRMQRAEGDRWRFEVLSPDEPADSEVIARGSIEQRGDGAHRPEPAPAPAGSWEPVDSSATPADGAARLFELGPRWNGPMRRATADGHEVLEIDLPAAFVADLDTHPVHPGLLDLATSFIQDASSGTHLPFHYERLEILAPFRPSLRVEVRRRPPAADSLSADIRIFAKDGTCVADIGGFIMRRVSAADLRSKVQGEEDGAVPTAPERPRGDAGGGPPPQGLPMVVGGELLLQLVERCDRRTVAVRPFERGLPVPLDDDAAPAPLHAPAPAPVAAPAPAVAPQVAPVPAAPAQAPPAPARPARPATAQSPPAAAGPGSSLEDAVLAIVAEVLGVEHPGLDDDFFELGGDSLSAIEVMAHVRDRLGVELGVGELFASPTPRTLAALIETRKA